MANEPSSKRDENDANKADPTKVNVDDSLSENQPAYNARYIINTTDNIRTYERGQELECKVLILEAESDFSNIVDKLKFITPIRFPNLFFIEFVMKENGPSNGIQQNLEEIAEHLGNTFNKRPFFLQISTADGCYYRLYKEENSNDFRVIQNGNCANFDNLLSFFWCVINRQITKFDDTLIEQILKAQESASILRFLKIFELPSDFSKKLLHEIVARGTIDQFLAILDDPVEYNGQMLNFYAQRMLSSTFQDPFDASEESILHISVENSNKGIFKYLVDNCTHLLQELPFEHKVKISSTAFHNRNFDFLSDLLNIDFPFPQDFNPYGITDSRLREIINWRNYFAEAIQNDNEDKIRAFVGNCGNLKYVFDIDNKSALWSVIRSKNPKIYYLLKHYGFQLPSVEKNVLQEEIAKLNFDDSFENISTSVEKLNSKLIIQNERNKQKELEYRIKFNEWIENIYKDPTCAAIINVVVQCDELKIFVNPKCDLVSDEAGRIQGVYGFADIKKRIIVIGGKLADEKGNNREGIIKQTIIYELCHQALDIVFENNARPYYKFTHELAQLFENTVRTYSYLEQTQFMAIAPDDGCSGIISAVYNGYAEEVRHQELIVRVPQIIVHCDGNKEEIKNIKERYYSLFDHYDVFIATVFKIFDMNTRMRTKNYMNNLQQIINAENNFTAWENNQIMIEA